MRIIAKKYLIQFWVTHKNAEQPLRAWYDEAISANWQSPQDIKNQYRNASFVGNNRVVFNIKGNDYRLIVAVAYRIGVLYIKFIGSHAAYDSIDAKTVKMEGI
jgi:mRNA interferase HigB